MESRKRGKRSRGIVMLTVALVTAAALWTADAVDAVEVAMAQVVDQLPHTSEPPTRPPSLPSTVQPQTPMLPPTAAPTVAPPPTSGPVQPTRPPRPTRTRGSGDGDDGGDGGDGDDGVGQPVQPTTATPDESVDAPPTRTRRPTRTPRTTATTTPTPMVAGGMQLTLAADPPLLVVGQPATMRLLLLNRMDRSAGNVTLQVVVPADVLVDRIESRIGHTAREGSLVRWFVPVLPAGEGAELRLVGVLGIGRPGGVDLCVTVLSAGAPMEHCARFDTTMPEAAEVLPTGTPTPAALDVEAEGGAPLAVSRTAIGWVLVLGGMVAVGLLIGDRLRRRGRRAGGD